MGRTRSGSVVGREEELAALRRFLRAVPSGPVALVLAGEAGIGKTTLWNEGVADARRRSYRVLSCRPAAAEANYPYTALGDLLEEVGDDVLSSLSGAPLRALEVALLRAEPAGHALGPRAVAAALRTVLVELAAAGPLLMAVDDAQWLDIPSSGALSFALRRLGQSPVGVLLSVRDGPDAALPLGLERIFPEDRLSRLTLGPLPADPLERLLEARLGTALPQEVRSRLRETSAGNPFFALELGRALRQRDDHLGPDDPLPVPDSLRTVIKERLETLAPDARGALLAASALDRPTPALVYAAGDGPAGSTEGLADAIEAGVIEVDGNQLRVTHPLLAAVVYAETAPELRRALHARLASLVDDPEQRARHLARAARGPDEAVASALDEASRRARLRGAPEVAASLSEQAVRLTPAARPEASRRRIFEAADHHFAAGGMARAEELLEGLRSSAPPGADRARAMQRLGEIEAQAAGFPAAHDRLAQALGEAGDDALLRLEIECDLAFAQLVGGDIPAGARRAEAALDLVQGLEDVPPPVMLTVLEVAALFEFLTGGGVRSDLLDRAMEIERWAGEEAVALRPGFLHLPHIPATILKWSDDLATARSRYSQAHAWTAGLGEESWLPWLLHHMAELECWAGNWEEAAHHGAEACAAAERTGQTGMRGFTLYAKALVAAHRGEVQESQRLAEEGLAASGQAGSVTAAQLNRSVLGFLALSLGDPREAQAHLGQVREAVSAMGLGDPGIVRCLPDEIEALIALGELEQAASLAGRLEEQGRNLGRAWALATAARCQALIRAAIGEWDTALEEVARAHKEHQTLDQPFERGRALLAEGTIRRRARQKRAARDALEAALSIFETLGAPLWTEKTRAELERIGGRPSPPGTLTPTEERVAALVASGWTNKEVATSLFMSVKTVESNLRHIYRKLGIRSRRELPGRFTAPDAADTGTGANAPYQEQS